MDALRFRIKGTMNFFRAPEFHTYQKTLLFPPKSTIVGLVNNCMGKSINDYYRLLKKLSVSVIINNIKGIGNDLWRFVKTKSGEVGKDICIRQFVYKPEYTIYIISQKSLLHDLKKSLEKPSRIPYLGRDDNLILIKEVKPVELKEVQSTKIDSVLNFDITTKAYNLKVNNYGSVVIPTVTRLPLEFEVGKKGERIPTNLCAFTYWYNINIEFKEPITCHTDGDFFVRIF